MSDNLQRPKGKAEVLSAMNLAVDNVDLAKGVARTKLARAVFGTVAFLLVMIRDTMIKEQDFIDLGLSCAHICKALQRGMGRKKLKDLDKSVCDAMNQLITTVADIQEKIMKRSQHQKTPRFLRSKNDKAAISAWKSDLSNILRVFDTEMDTHTTTFDTRQDLPESRRNTWSSLEDHPLSKDPASPTLLAAAKERYLARLSDFTAPGKPGSKEAQWMESEDVNVECLLHTFTSINQNSKFVWDTCFKLMGKLFRHKPRPATPDGHPSIKAQRLYDLSQLFDSVGNLAECKRLLGHALDLWREDGDDYQYQIARTLRTLAETNRKMGLRREGIPQAREASQIFERLGNTVRQARSLITLAWLLLYDNQPDVAEEIALRAIGLFPERGEERQTCAAHRALGSIYKSKGETEKAIHHCEIALEISSSFKMTTEQFWAHFALMLILSGQDKLDEAQAHADKARSLAASTYLFARATDQQARLWVKQNKLEEAKSRASRALDAFERLGAAGDVKCTKRLLQKVEARITR